MKVDDVVVCKSCSGYYRLQEGKEYRVMEYTAKYTDPDFPNFTWPAYVRVVGDDGKTIIAHADRFVLKEGT